MSTVWYFAYGSNMEAETLRRRRGIMPVRALPVRAPGWRLVLDKPPLVAVGTAFANLVADPTAETFGVAYELVPEDLDLVELTEGVRIGNYARVATAVVSLRAPWVALRAVTLVSDRRDPGLRPSDRYMARLVAGAEEHGLPAAWIAWLRTVPAVPESAEAARLQPVVEETFRVARETRRRTREPS